MKSDAKVQSFLDFAKYCGDFMAEWAECCNFAGKIVKVLWVN